MGKKEKYKKKVKEKNSKDPGESFVKWTQIKIRGNSFVKFSAGGPRTIYKGIPF